MIQSLQLHNLRLFSNLEINQLERINLLAGRNNSGKTSVLEAILLLTGGRAPQLVLDIPHLRGVGHLPKGTSTAFWKPMFADLDTSRTIEIKCKHSRIGDLTLTISRKQGNGHLRRNTSPTETERQNLRARAFQGFAMPSATGYSGEPWGIGLAWKGAGNTELRTMNLVADGNQVDFSGPETLFNAVFLSPSTGNVQYDADMLGELRAKKQGYMLEDVLREIEPRLKTVEVSPAGGTPMIWADIGLAELVPLSALGEGMTRIARIVLAISGVQDGVVLVDEIETGIHHSAMPRLWEVVSEAARKFNVQVFATTHSFECFAAASGALGDDWRYHRLERSKHGSGRCITFDREDVAAVVKYGFEVR